MKKTDKLKDSLTNLQALKNDIAKDILANKKLTKIQKLKKLEKDGIWGYANSVQHEFSEWEKEFSKVKGVSCIDSIYDPSNECYDKYSDISYANSLEDLVYDVDEDGLITVLTNRSNSAVIKKTPEEIIDVVFDFCVKEKIIGFKMDW